jgi:hypothetical protein
MGGYGGPEGRVYQILQFGHRSKLLANLSLEETDDWCFQEVIHQHVLSFLSLFWGAREFSQHDPVILVSFRGGREWRQTGGVLQQHVLLFHAIVLGARAFSLHELSFLDQYRVGATWSPSGSRLVVPFEACGEMAAAWRDLSPARLCHLGALDGRRDLVSVLVGKVVSTR